MSAARYPRRPQYFALKFIREMIDARVAGTLGEEAFTLLVVIAQQEDAVHYKRPVDFFNDPLRDRCGGWSLSKLARAREKAVEGGWLRYRPGGREGPGVYWVLSRYYSDDGKPAGPGGNDADCPSRSSPKVNRITEGSRVGSRTGSRRTFNPTPTHPTPGAGESVGADEGSSPREEQGAEADPRFRRLFDNYPRKDKAHEAAEAFAALSPDDDLLNRMLAAVEAQKRSRKWTQDGGRFVPHLCNWVAGKRWNDPTEATTAVTVAPQKPRRWVEPRDPPDALYIPSLRALSSAEGARVTTPELPP